MKRTQIVTGNWKMNKTLAEGQELVAAVLEKMPVDCGGEVVFAAPFIHLDSVSKILKGKKSVHLAAQNVHQSEKGAFTGEISADMLASVGCDFVLVGHSERREYFKESHAVLAEKVAIALSKNIRPIFCCGEPLSIRQKEKHVNYVAKQLKESVFQLEEIDFKKIVIAYEPIWAIGTGVTASTAQAQDMHLSIRKMVARRYGKRVANVTTILYGGSCNAQNAPELFAQPDVDGGLIGGASLKADDFVAIVAAMKKA